MTYEVTDADRDLISRVAAAGIGFPGNHAEIRVASELYRSSAVYHLLGTEDASGEPSITYEQRKSRCYELAGFAIAFTELAELGNRARLVHGSMHGPREDQVRIGHAWVEIGRDLIWEPVMCLIRDRAEWVEHARPRDERTYSLTDARRLIATTQHFGRWHESRYP